MANGFTHFIYNIIMRHSIFLMNPNKSDEVRKERHWFNRIRDYGM